MFKKVISILLILTMMVGILPQNVFINTTWANDGPTVEINYIFDNPSSFQIKQKNISIRDKALTDLFIQKGEDKDREKVIGILKEGKYVTYPVEDFGDFIQATIDSSLDVPTIRVMLKNDKTKYIEYSGIVENESVRASSVITPQVDGKGPIKLIGKGLGSFVEKRSTVVVKVGNNIVYAKKSGGTLEDEIEIFPSEAVANNTQNNDAFALGNQNITIESTIVKPNYTLKINNFYRNSVQIIGVLPLEGIEMFPTTGQAKDIVKFTRNQLNKYDVYFVKDVADSKQFNTAHKATFLTLGKDETNTKDILRVEVPALPEGVGEYFVVLTNAESDKGIKERYILKDKNNKFVKFNYIQSSRISLIDDFFPKEAPEQTPTEIQITGLYLGKLNLEGFNQTIPTVSTGNYRNSPVKVIELDYGTGTFTTGGKEYKDTKVKRQIKVSIGRDLDILEYDFPQQGSERIIVRTQDVTNVNVDNTVKVVLVTIIETKEGTFTMEREVLANSLFTFIPRTEKPEILKVTPSIIPVEQNTNNALHHISSSVGEELDIHIEGKNFLVTRVNNKPVYPKVKLGSLEINPNEANSNILSFQVLDEKDNVVDGSSKLNEKGSKIIVRVKTGPTGFNTILSPGKQAVAISNPWRGTNNQFDPYMPIDGKIEFVKSSKNAFPVIANVNPRVVPAEGGETVEVTGSNFLTGAKVYIDGKEVGGVQISGDNKKVTFKAPKGREGETQIMVINPGGALAVREFFYTKTYSDPKFTELNPKKGSTNTTVVVSGQNFIPKDPTVSAENFESFTENIIYRLIGTRIFMNNKDINEYNIEDGKIKLKRFTGQDGFSLRENILTLPTKKEDPIVLGEDFRSTIFLDEEYKKFYRIEEDAKGNLSLVDGVGNIYAFQQKDNEIIAVSQKDGLQYKVEQPQKGVLALKYNQNTNFITVKAYTPFKLGKVKEGSSTYDAVVGNRVFVIHSGKLIFTVPFLTGGDGLYDVKIVNPDTKSIEIKQSFYYYSSPVIIPEVEYFTPTSGADKGGNIVTFYGPDTLDDKVKFVDNGIEKTKVFIGEQEVPQKDVTVSPDGKKLTIMVPKYNKNIRDFASDRITESVVLVNPDGGSFNIDLNTPLKNNVKGYTYILSSSNPKISSMVPNSGPAVGGNTVELFGTDFRDWEPFSDENGNGKKDENEAITLKVIEGLNEHIKRFYKDNNNNGRFDVGVDGIYKKDGTAPEVLVESKFGKNLKHLDSPLLPKVYFGTKEAEISAFQYGYIQVIVPPGEGTVDVYIVNNDAGISNVQKYTYNKTAPIITSVVPNVGKKEGQDLVEVQGSEFYPQTIQFLSPNNIRQDQHMPLVRMGNITNKGLPREDKNSGVVRSGTASVELLGGVVAQYDALSQKITVGLEEEGKLYKREFSNYDGSSKFINSLDLEYDSNGVTEKYKKEQLIKVEVRENRLIVEAGYAPKVLYNNSKHVVVTSPAYYTVGEVDLTLINPDQSEAKGKFTYKNPDSFPKITEVQKEGEAAKEETLPSGEKARVIRLSYKGGNTITILGEDFRNGATVNIGNAATITSENLVLTQNNKITFKMPAVSESAVGAVHRITVTNEDGASAMSDKLIPPIYVIFVKGETSPRIDKVEPNLGSGLGGKKIRIIGNDFRKEMYGQKLKVYIGGITVDPNNITYIDYRTIDVIVPPYLKGGTVEVIVENPDGELSNPTGSFTYISAPKIDNVIDLMGRNKVDKISVEGGQKLEIQGDGFHEDTKVYFSPVLKKVDGKTPENANIVYIGEEAYILEKSVDAAEVKFIDEKTLEVTTPQGRNDTTGILIVNGDKGAAEYKTITYGLPKLNAPTDLLAELINNNRLIKLSWKKAQNAKYYEIYVIANNKEPYYIGSTEKTEIVIEELEPNTVYSFKVKAVGDFGSSDYSNPSNKVTTGKEVGKEDVDGKIGEKNKEEIQGSMVHITIGYNDTIPTIDLTKSKYAKVDKVVISLPAQSIKKHKNKGIKVTGKDYVLEFTPEAFDVRSMDTNREDAGVKFTIGAVKDVKDVQGSANQTILSTVYLLEAESYVGKDKQSISQTKKEMTLILDYNKKNASSRKKDGHVTLSYYNDYDFLWEDIAERKEEKDAFVKGKISMLGNYSIIGKR